MKTLRVLRNPQRAQKAKMDWCVYIVKCADDTLYTGIAKDLEKRIKAHNSGKGAKYTMHRRPVSLVYSEEAETRSLASQREYVIKQLSRTEKLKLLKLTAPHH